MGTFKRRRLYDHDDDRISALPDCVLLEILSALPKKDAVQTSCLSKRWTSLWTLLPNLVFRNTSDTPDDHFFSCVDKTMTQLPSHHKLNKFQLRSVYYDHKYESRVNKWIRHAISCNVQDLHLSLGYTDNIVLDELLFNNSIFTHLKLTCSFINPTGTFSWINLKSLYISLTYLNEDLIQNILSGSPVLETFTLDNCHGFKKLDITSKSVKKFAISCNVQGYRDIVLDELLFNNSIFTHLKLGCSFVNPTGIFSWINLKSLYISMTHLNENLLQNILSRSPRLETFALHNCYGFGHLDITSKSVKKFVISGDTHFVYVLATLNAPNILSLKIQGSLILGGLFLEDLSSLVEAYLDYTYDDNVIDDLESKERSLAVYIDSLVHVKELKLGLMCSRVLSSLEAGGFIAPSNIKRIVDAGPEDREVD